MNTGIHPRKALLAVVSLAVYLAAIPAGSHARGQASFHARYAVEAYYDPMNKHFPDVGVVELGVEKAPRKSYIISVAGEAKNPNNDEVYRMDVSRRYLFSRNSAYRLPHDEAGRIDGDSQEYRLKVYRILPFVHLTRKILRRAFKKGTEPTEGSYFVPVTDGRGNETLDLHWERQQNGVWHAILHDVDGKLGDFFLEMPSNGIPRIQEFYVNFSKEVEMRCRVASAN